MLFVLFDIDFWNMLENKLTMMYTQKTFLMTLCAVQWRSGRLIILDFINVRNRFVGDHKCLQGKVSLIYCSNCSKTIHFFISYIKGIP